MFIEYEKELYISNQLNKDYKEYIGDNIIKNDIINKVCGDNIENICSEKGELYKNTSINSFFKISNVNCNQTNNYFVKKYQNTFLNLFMCQV